MAHKYNDFDDMIPDYCNNRLEKKLRADFDSRLIQDKNLREQLEDFRSFQQLYRQANSVEPPPSDALFGRIVHATVGNMNRERSGQRNHRIGQSLRESIGKISRLVQESVSFPWMLAGIQAVVIVLLLIPVSRQDEIIYKTLSGQGTHLISAQQKINVVFKADTVESDIRGLLSDISARMIDGPSQEGRYVIAIDTSEKLEDVIAMLRQSSFVLFAETVN